MRNPQTKKLADKLNPHQQARRQRKIGARVAVANDLRQNNAILLSAIRASVAINARRHKYMTVALSGGGRHVGGAGCVCDRVGVVVTIDIEG